jgi:hypothetical protein
MSRHLRVVGKTPEGRVVVSGVYSLFETTGIPLSDTFARLWSKGILPEWVDLVRKMADAGRPLARCIETVEAAVNDACYPTAMRDGIVLRLHQLGEP